jgi:Golgi SNAP receptor complex protein 2
MEHLLQQVRNSLAETRQQMKSLSQGTGDSQVLELRVEENLQQLEQDCYRLENYARKEVPQRRQEAKYRVDQEVAEVNDLKRAFQAFKHRKENEELEARQREELLSRRFVPNSEESSIQIDHSLQHHTSLQNANAQLDEIISSGRYTFSSLQSQYLTLKGVQRKVLDVMNTLGLSNTVMRVIERRTSQDKWIFWTGLCVTVTVMVLVVMYFA